MTEGDAHTHPESFDAKALAGELVRQFGSSETLRRSGEYVLPRPEATGEIIALLRQVLFPGYVGREDPPEEDIERHLEERLARAQALLAEEIARSFRHTCKQLQKLCDQCRGKGESQAALLMRKLPDIRRRLEEDVQAAFEGDPAARNYDEVMLCYPALFAITVHRIAHELHVQHVPFLPRLMSELAHASTGIDIHPGAKIGRHFFIDHGTGVVIGETTVIGDHVKLYQGVTLGALSFPRDACGALIRDAKRHPTLEDHVTIYAGATVLGGDTVVGRGSVIGGNVWLTHSVPPGTKVLNETPRLRLKNSSQTIKDEYIPDFQI
jgi:serine O-acetyltransferase